MTTAFVAHIKHALETLFEAPFDVARVDGSLVAVGPPLDGVLPLSDVLPLFAAMPRIAGEAEPLLEFRLYPTRFGRQLIIGFGADRARLRAAIDGREARWRSNSRREHLAA